MLMDHHWPGNVRELQNIMERAWALAAGPSWKAAIFISMRHGGKAAGFPASFLPEGMTLEQWEDEMIREALRRAMETRARRRGLLGLSRNALRYRLSKIGITDEPEKENEE